jgi:hypothetical protein
MAVWPPLTVDSTLQDSKRVWFFMRSTGTMSNDWNVAGMTLKATGKQIQNGTEVDSMIWTPDKKIKCARLPAARRACSISASVKRGAGCSQLAHQRCERSREEGFALAARGLDHVASFELISGGLAASRVMVFPLAGT